MDLIAQESFAGGIFRGRRAPANTVYDAINALVNDERELYRRGGSTYKSASNAAAAIVGVSSVIVAAGTRTLLWTSAEMFRLDSGDAPADLKTAALAPPRPLSRVVTLRGMAFFIGLSSSGLSPQIVYYAGSLKVANDTTGTVTVTQGSTQVTGAGTAFLANADNGTMLIQSTAGFPQRNYLGVVRSVTSDTELQLEEPWTAPTATFTTRLSPHFGHVPVAWGASAAESFDYSLYPNNLYLAAAGERLLIGGGNRVSFSMPGQPIDLLADDYHTLPEGSVVTGMEAIRDTGVVFTTGGVWAISNLTLDALDDYGNVQHVVSQVSKDVILWDDPGLVGWRGGLVVPAIDDVYLFGVDGQASPISQAIRPLYRSYVKAGYKLGVAQVHRGHYFLPVVNGTTLVDTLVCRLDGESPAWTRWADHGGSISYAQEIGSSTRSPKLYGIAGLRVTDLTGCFDPDAARDDDADGTDHQFTVETRDFDLIGNSRKPGTAEKAELVYELDGTGCTVAVSWSSGEEGSSYTALTAIRGGGESDGADYSVWPVNKARRSVRFKVVQSGAAAKMILRRVLVRVRGSGV